jgi:hypothetical protein
MVLKYLCILDFFRAAAFLLIMPFREAVSIFFTISLRAASDAGTSFFRANTTNFLMLVRTALFAVLFRILRSSLCRWRFSAELLFLAKRNPQIKINCQRTSALSWYKNIALLEIRRAAFKPFAFFTFGNVLYFSAFKQGFHFNFAPA